MDLEEVEGCGGQVKLAGRGVEAATGEPVDDLLRVADAGFDGRATAFVKFGAFRCSQPVPHEFARAGLSGWWAAVGGGPFAGW